MQMKEIINKPLKKVYYSIATKYYYAQYGFEELLEKQVYERKKNHLLSLPHNENQTYFIIRRSFRNIGLCTHLCVYISFIAYALQRGWIPVIDMKNYPNIYLEDSEIGVSNAWEKFFRQPLDVRLEDIPRNARKIYSSSLFLPKRTPFLSSLLHDQDEYSLYRSIYQDFVHYSDGIGSYIEDELRLISDCNVLGVLCRGTDYTGLKPKGHPIQPSIRQALEKTNEFFVQYNCDAIYLATDEKAIEDAFQEQFAGRIITNKRMYYDSINADFSKVGISDIEFNRDNDRFLKGLEYISSMNLLSKCKYFIGGGGVQERTLLSL